MTDTTTELIDLETVQETARRVAEEHPDKLNPTDGKFCVYTSDTDPDDHCYGGQILVELGIPVPTSSTRLRHHNDVVRQFEEDAFRLLENFQLRADTRLQD